VLRKLLVVVRAERNLFIGNGKKIFLYSDLTEEVIVVNKKLMNFDVMRLPEDVPFWFENVIS